MPTLNVIQLVSNKVWGGGEQYVLELCRRLRADSHNVAVITRGCQAVDTPFIEAGFTPGHLPLGGIFDFISASRLSRVLDNIDTPVLIHAHNFKDARTAVNARQLCHRPERVRIVVTRHLVKPAKTSQVATALYNKLDAIAFVSEAARQAFLSTSPKIDTSKIVTIHNAVAPQPVPVVPLDKASGELRLVFAGRLAREKGIETLLEAMARLQADATLFIAGTGKAAYENNLRRYADHLGIATKIKWCGHLADPFPLMASADIGIVPTIVSEAFGLTALEFMSLGVPVIASRSGGLTEIITPDTDGILVAPADAEALALAIDSLATDSTLRHTLARKAKETAESRFGYDTFYSKILNLYTRQ